MEPLFSLCYTTRRAHLLVDVINLWRARAANPEQLEVVLCLDEDDVESRKAAEGLRDTKVVLQTVQPFNCVRGWNKAAEESAGKVIVCVADDFTPPRQWDSALLGLRPDQNEVVSSRRAQGLPYPSWVDGDFIVHVDDGYVRTIATLSILTRPRYQRFGYVFYPQYESMFCDTEFTERAKLDGAVINAMHLLFEHIHPACGKRAQDSHDIKHASSERWQRGEALFNMRRALGFPADGESHVTRKYAAYIQAIKDDFCLFEVCARLHEEGVRDFFFCVPDEYWSGRDISAEELREVNDVWHRVAHELPGATAQLRVFDVSTYRAPGRSRIEVETLLRNDSLRWMREEGFNHILIVDGDELWRRGLLKMVDQTVDRVSPDIIACHMIPVIGLPGYPVDQAQDKVSIYVGNGVQFHDCRSANGKRATLGFHGVFHFTATRKTMDEIVKKHRESGHYDDPNYDFEGWIATTLPNIRVGSTNVHMYRPYQIWPVVRAWSRDELAQIPDNLHQYLGTEVVTAAPQTSAAPTSAPPPTAPQTPHGVRKVSSFPPSRLGNTGAYRRV
jgi:glycosyltransferase involved in cell wall biosynthesis